MIIWFEQYLFKRLTTFNQETQRVYLPVSFHNFRAFNSDLFHSQLYILTDDICRMSSDLRKPFCFLYEETICVGASMNTFCILNPKGKLGIEVTWKTRSLYSTVYNYAGLSENGFQQCFEFFGGLKLRHFVSIMNKVFRFQWHE